MTFSQTAMREVAVVFFPFVEMTIYYTDLQIG